MKAAMGLLLLLICGLIWPPLFLIIGIILALGLLVSD